MLKRLPILLVLALGCGQDHEPAVPQGLVASGCDLAVVHSDYVSTSISVLNEAGELCRDGLIDSGTAIPGLTTALSGDVVLAQTPHPAELLILIDRYPNAVITTVDVRTNRVHTQFNVGTGFAANPTDVIFGHDGSAFVTRMGRNPAAGSTPYDGGADLLHIHGVSGEIRGRIDLQPYAGPDVDASPDGVFLVGSRMLVPLRNLSKDFQTGEDGRIAVIDTEAQAVIDTIELGPLKNCGGLIPVGPAVWGVCTGVFGEGANHQEQSSGLFQLGEQDETWRLRRTVTANELGGGTLGLTLAPLSGGRVAFSRLGAADAGGRDILYVLDPTPGELPRPVTDTGAFEMGGLLATRDGEGLWVCDANPRTPRLRLFTGQPDRGWSESATVDGSPKTGLPPRLIRRFR